MTKFSDERTLHIAQSGGRVFDRRSVSAESGGDTYFFIAMEDWALFFCTTVLHA